MGPGSRSSLKAAKPLKKEASPTKAIAKGKGAKAPKKGEKKRKVAEAPWSVAKWAVAPRLDNPRATVLVLLLG